MIELIPYISVISFQRKHRDVYLDYKNPDPEEQSTLANFVKPTGSQKYQLNDPKQKEVTDSLIKYIAGDLLPCSTVESQNFIRTLQKNLTQNFKFRAGNISHLN